jgi:nucleoside 2-deoxyribosyltransferase
MAKLFLSYTFHDRELIDRLDQALKSAGQTVFVDRGKVAEGSSWAETIRDEIEKADAFIVVVSRDSLSRDSAVGSEVGAAWGRGKRIVAIETSDVSVADSLRLPRTDYEVVSSKGLSDSQLVAAILEKANTDATSAAS